MFDDIIKTKKKRRRRRTDVMCPKCGALMVVVPNRMVFKCASCGSIAIDNNSDVWKGWEV